MAREISSISESMRRRVGKGRTQKPKRRAKPARFCAKCGVKLKRKYKKLCVRCEQDLKRRKKEERQLSKSLSRDRYDIDKTVLELLKERC